VTVNSETIRLLCAADLHLGRRPSRVPPGDDELSVASVWRRIVEAAVTRDVDAVLMAGDVVDEDNQYFEALGPLQEGVRQLTDHDIPVFAVAGNHDWDVLPRLAEAVDREGFHLLGRGGQWEAATLEVDGEPTAEIVGWSFPDAHPPESPLEGAGPATETDLPAVGLLHADLGADESRYGPVDRTELEAAAPTAWVLGHLHQPAEHDLAGGLALYPGSPQPLDPGEGDRHGISMLEFESDGAASVVRRPVASLQYVECEVDLADVETEDDFRKQVSTRLDDLHRETVDAAPDLEQVVYRITFTGRTAAHRRVSGWSEQLVDQFTPRFDGTVGRVDETRVATRPTYDLEKLARSDDPPGVVAQLILQLERGEPSGERTTLVRRLRQTLLEDVYNANAYAPLRADSETSGKPDRREVEAMLVEQGWLLLDQLMDQKTPSR
jgi:predicted phosphodiesterase